MCPMVFRALFTSSLQISSSFFAGEILGISPNRFFLAEPILSTPVIEYRNWNLAAPWMNSWCWPTTTSPNHAPSHQDTCSESLLAETAPRMCCEHAPIPSWGMLGCSQSHGFPLFLKENLVDSSSARISSPHRKSLYLRYHLIRYRRFHSSIQSPLSRDSLLFK
jgi:hypothetical protein